MLSEREDSSGTLGAYFFQDLLVARWILEDRPRRHLDVGSRIDGFLGHLAVFRDVEAIDIRPQPVTVANIRFHQMDLMAELPQNWVGCTDSLSCLHTIEHFGLGRYGDTINPLGHLRGLEQMKRLVEDGGLFYLSTPIGHERVEFNAHRVFSPKTVLSWFPDGWTIERSAVIDDGLAVLESEGDAALVEATCGTGVGIVAARKAAVPPATII